MINRALVPLAALAILAAPPAAQAATDPYIIVLEDGVDDPAAVADAQQDRYGTTEPTHVFDDALTGYTAEVRAGELRALRDDDSVAYVERDRRMSLATTQESPRWGLDRIDERKHPLDDEFRYDREGDGVTAYVLDTGLRASHEEFGGRASTSPDFVGDGEAGTSGGDCHGHGTHVAATLAGRRYGVAKSASWSASASSTASETVATPRSSTASTGSRATTPPTSPPWPTSVSAAFRAARSTTP